MLPLPIRVLGVFEGTTDMETKLHRRLSKWRTRGEWYQVCEQFLKKIHRCIPVCIEASCSDGSLKLFSPSEWDPGAMKKRLVTLDKQNDVLRASVAEAREEKKRLRRKIAILQGTLREERARSPDARSQILTTKLQEEVRALRLQNADLWSKVSTRRQPAPYNDDDDLSAEIRRTMAEAEEAVRKMEEADV